MSIILNSQSANVVFNLIRTIQENKEYLSEVDGAIGDGDHGVNMSKGFTICKTRLEGLEKLELTTSLNTLGKILLMEIGGSMGPLYGTFFIEMSKACRDKEEIDKNIFGEMIEASLKGLQTLSKAEIGDKTIMDTLVPAIIAYKESLAQGKGFAECLQAMKEAAEKGKESTKDMVAKIGRASRLGERSRGALDAGATSCNLILKSISDSILLIIS